MSKKNLKANHNLRWLRWFCFIVVLNLVKEKFESKSQRHQKKNNKTNVVVNLVKSSRGGQGKIWPVPIHTDCVLYRENKSSRFKALSRCIGIKESAWGGDSKSQLRRDIKHKKCVVVNLVKEKSESKSQQRKRLYQCLRCCCKSCQRKIWKQITTLGSHNEMKYRCCKSCQRKIWKQITTSHLI